MKNGIKKIFTGASFLASCSVLAKILGALYRIPLTTTLGAEGMGLYQMVYPVYTLLITLCSGGLTVAVAKTVSSAYANGDGKGAVRFCKIACVGFTIISSVLALILVVFALPLSSLQGNKTAGWAYFALAPSIVLTSVSSCLRGYCQGRENMFPTAVSQITEQIVKLSLGLFLAQSLSNFGVEWAVVGALIGVSTSELFCLVFLLFAFKFQLGKRKKIKTKKGNGVVRATSFLPSSAEFSNETVLIDAGINASAIAPERSLSALSVKQTILNLIKSGIPVAYGALVLPLTAVADSLLVVNLLTYGGQTTSSATALFGLYTGAVMTIINLPAVVLGSFSTVLLPVVAKKGAKARDDIAFTMKAVVVVAVVLALCLAVFSDEIISFLYGEGVGVTFLPIAKILLSIGSVSVVCVAIVQVCTASLQGFSMSSRPAVNLAFGGVIKVGVTVVGLLVFGIYGAAIGSVACYVFTALVDYVSLNKTLKARGERQIKLNLKSLILPTALFAIVGFVLKALLFSLGAVLRALIAGAICTVIFILATYYSKYFSAVQKRKIGSFFQH